ASVAQVDRGRTHAIIDDDEEAGAVVRAGEIEPADRERVRRPGAHKPEARDVRPIRGHPRSREEERRSTDAGSLERRAVQEDRVGRAVVELVRVEAFPVENRLPDVDTRGDVELD